MSPVARPLGSASLGGTGTVSFLNEGLHLQIGSVDVTQWVIFKSFSMEQQLSGRDQLEFTIVNNQSYLPQLGERVIASYRGGFIFIGNVHEREVEFIYTPQNISLNVQVRCVDLNAIADRRYVAEVYENMTAGDIVREIALKYMTIELLNLGNIHPGVTVTKVVFPRMSVAACLDSLCEQSGYYWNIDVNLYLNFFPRTFSPAPFTITSANAVFRDMRASMTMNQYRNVEYVDGGKGLTDSRTEAFRGDGTQKSFNTEYKVSTVPTITLNGVGQTVGIRGIDEGKRWYWSKGETSIGQDNLQPTLTAADLLFVIYRGEFNLIQVVEDSDAIIDRQLVEGGTGRYEHLIQDSRLDGQELVEERGLSLLRRYSTLDHTATFETDIEGLAVGQFATFNVPEFYLVGEFLITNIETSFVLSTLRRFRVTATDGEIKNKFTDFFARFLAGSQSVTISEGEILQEVTARRDLVNSSDSMTSDLVDVTVDQWGTAEVGVAEFAA